MLCLYLDTLIIGHKFCSMLSILNEITSQQELQNFMTYNGFWTKKVLQQQCIKANKIPCHSRKSNPGPLAPQSDRLKSSYLTVLWVES